MGARREGHPVMREGNGWSSITASTRKVSISGWSAKRVQEVKETLCELFHTNSIKVVCVHVRLLFCEEVGSGHLAFYQSSSLKVCSHLTSYVTFIFLSPNFDWVVYLKKKKMHCIL